MKATRLQLDLRAAIDGYIKNGWEIVRPGDAIFLVRGTARKEVRNGCIIDG